MVTSKKTSKKLSAGKELETVPMLPEEIEPADSRNSTPSPVA